MLHKAVIIRGGDYFHGYASALLLFAEKVVLMGGFLFFVEGLNNPGGAFILFVVIEGLLCFGTGKAGDDAGVLQMQNAELNKYNRVLRIMNTATALIVLASEVGPAPTWDDSDAGRVISVGAGYCSSSLEVPEGAEERGLVVQADGTYRLRSSTQFWPGTDTATSCEEDCRSTGICL